VGFCDGLQVPYRVVGVGGLRLGGPGGIRGGQLGGQFVVGVVGVVGHRAGSVGGLGDVVVAVIHRGRGGDVLLGSVDLLLGRLDLPEPAEHVIGVAGRVAERVGDREDVPPRVITVSGRVPERVCDGLRVPGRVVVAVIGGVSVRVRGRGQVPG